MIDMVGERFGSLVVLRRNGAKRGQALWRCKCDCGSECDGLGYKLRKGIKISCGCREGEGGGHPVKHGHCPKDDPSPTWESWHAMVGRCTNDNASNYARYGGRGIRVCERWLGDDGFVNFLADVGERPEGKTLDRFPNRDGNYEPGNVRWATAKEQARRRSNGKLTPEIVARIRELAASGMTHQSIADEIGLVPRRTISGVIERRTWT